MGVGKMRKDEKGSVIVEATYVFPIVFFVIFFLLFMGDAYYLQSQVDSLTNQAAVLAAADCADPIAARLEEKGQVDIGEWPELYRYIFTGGYMKDASGKLKERLENAVGSNAGFFAGMKANIITCDVKYRASIIEPTCVATSKCDIRLPIRFIFADDNMTISMTAKAEAPVVDMSDFIQNVEMIGDYMESTGLTEKLNELKDKLKGFISGNQSD